jgi:DNA-binding beta-propeller fold protein YncE
VLPTACLVVWASACDAPYTTSTGAAAGRAGGFTVSPVDHPRGFELTGGTLLLAEQGRLAVISDPDADRLWLVDLQPAAVRAKVSVPQGSHPGRMALDDAGDVYVVLRGMGQVAKLSTLTKQLVLTRDVCADPRGITWDAKAQVMRVACASGDLAELPVQGPAMVSHLQADLRDVLVTADGPMVTTFRQARLAAAGATGWATPPEASTVNGPTVKMSAHVAWRTVVAPDGTIVMAHQREVEGPVEALTLPSGATGFGAGTAAASSPAYSSAAPGNPCLSPVVRSSVTFFAPSGTSSSVELGGTLPVDVAVSPDGKEAAVALAGSGTVERVALGTGSGVLDSCVRQGGFQTLTVGGTPDGVAFQSDGTLVVHTSQPSTLAFFKNGVPSRGALVLDTSLGKDPGRAFFHTPVNGIACASCHPEGRDDGHVWTLNALDRRTPSLASGLLETAPFHWQGEFNDIGEVVDDTFVHRMGGLKPDVSTVNELANWVEGVPRPAPTAGRSDRELKLISMGKALFEDRHVGCTQCHTGETLNTPASQDVGTGGRFQVPSLRGVGVRGPWLHNGAAQTLRDRFKVSGSDRHGNTSQLSEGQIDLLTLYLESL